MVTATNQKAISQPWLEETILIGFVEMHLAAEDNFHINGVGQENDQFRPNPHASNVGVALPELQCELQNFYGNGWQ